MSVKARMKVVNVTTYGEGENRGGSVALSAVYSADPESPNYTWSRATPSGQINLSITNPSALAQFEHGQEFEITFEPVQA